jgi:hypothetical protein
MAEVLGVVASVVAVAQLAGELVVTAQKLYAFWVGVKGAPKQVGDALKEIQLVGKIIAGMGVEEQNGFGGDREDIVWEALSYCREVMEEFGYLLGKLGMDMASRKAGKRQWASLKVFLKSQVLSELEGKFERAKSLLGLAVDFYSM